VRSPDAASCDTDDGHSVRSVVGGAIVRRSLLACVALLALSTTSCRDTSGPASLASDTTPSAAASSAPAAAETTVPAPTAAVRTAAPTRPPATRPPTTRPPTHAPAPARTTTAPKPAPLSTCGAAPNPWGYNFCGRGSFISNPPAAFCDYFDCIPSFWDSTNGYVMQCDDLTYSHSGGRSGSCSYHDGNYRALLG
jgi:hypothetical protein